MMHSANVPAMSSGPCPVPASRPKTSLRRRLQRRALADAAIALMLVPAVLLLSADPNTQLRLCILAASFAVLAFMIRRSQDLAEVRADLRARDLAMAGRGISIAEWHAGTPLPPWQERGQPDAIARSEPSR